MVEINVNLKDCKCGKCHKSLEKEKGVFRALLKSEETFCYDCKIKDYREAVQNNNNSKYVLYYVEGGIGKLEIDNASFDSLFGGIYELQQLKDKYDNIFYVESTLDRNESTTDFLSRIDCDSFVLEKRRGNTCLFFPEKRVSDIFDFYDNQKNCDDIISEFRKWSKSDNYKYICESNRIYGITAKPLRSYDSTVLDAKGPDKFRLETMEDLKEFYINNAIGRYMTSSLQQMTPTIMLDYCENRIQGQDLELKKAVYKIYHYVQSVASGKPFQAENWLLTSPSGTGKTEFFRTIRDLFREYNIPIPVVQIDLSQITETGFKGANVSTIPQRILSEKKRRAVSAYASLMKRIKNVFRATVVAVLIIMRQFNQISLPCLRE